MSHLGDITIPAAFNGPPASGHGGYAAGLFARFFETPHTVRISAPIPLDTQLTVSRDGGRLVASSGGAPIMTARPSEAANAAAPPPTLEAARHAREAPIDFGASGPSTCFVCGRNRAEGEGLRIWCGRAEGFVGAVDVWTPHARFCDADGRARLETIWAALDCPGGYALPEDHRRVLLGEMTAQILSPPRAGEPAIVTARHISSDGRKHLCATALHSAAGDLFARADTLWIELKPEQAEALFP